MPRYAIRVTGRCADGCQAHIDFELEDGEVPEPGIVAEIVALALDPEETNLFDFLAGPHRHGGHEKITVTGEVKVL